MDFLLQSDCTEDHYNGPACQYYAHHRAYSVLFPAAIDLTIYCLYASLDETVLLLLPLRWSNILSRLSDAVHFPVNPLNVVPLTP